MFDKFKNYIDESPKKQNLYALVVFATLSILTICVNFIPTVNKAAQINSVIPTWLQLTSYITATLYIILCIICRVKKYGNTLRGIFFYQLPSILFFIIELGLLIANCPSAGSFFMDAFDAWTFLARPFSYLITPLIGMSEMYTKLMIELIFILISGYSYVGMKNDIAFKKKIAEKHELENRHRS